MRNSHAVLHSDYQFTFPPAEYKPSLLFTFLLAFLISFLFDDSHTNRCKVGDLIVILVCVFLLIGYVERLFMYLLHIVCLIWKKKNLFQSFAYFEIVFFFFYWIVDTILFRKPWRSAPPHTQNQHTKISCISIHE